MIGACPLTSCAPADVTQTAQRAFSTDPPNRPPCPVTPESDTLRLYGQQRRRCAFLPGPAHPPDHHATSCVDRTAQRVPASSGRAPVSCRAACRAARRAGDPSSALCIPRDGVVQSPQDQRSRGTNTQRPASIGPHNAPPRAQATPPVSCRAACRAARRAATAGGVAIWPADLNPHSGRGRGHSHPVVAATMVRESLFQSTHFLAPQNSIYFRIPCPSKLDLL